MGRLRITKNGIILEGPAEFVKTLKAKYIVSRGVCISKINAFSSAFLNYLFAAVTWLQS